MALASTIHLVIPQGDDRRVTEHHIDGAGKLHIWTYITALDSDLQALLVTHAEQLARWLADAELEKILNG